MTRKRRAQTWSAYLAGRQLILYAHMMRIEDFLAGKNTWVDRDTISRALNIPRTTVLDTLVKMYRNHRVRTMREQKKAGRGRPTTWWRLAR